MSAAVPTAARERFIISARLEFALADYDVTDLDDDQLWEGMVCVARRLAHGDYEGSPGIPLVPTGLTAAGFVKAVLADDPIARDALPAGRLVA
jgi:hypothetical protein